MSERFEEIQIKNIGDAGDSMPPCLEMQQETESPVYEMAKCVWSAIRCGDHQNLKVLLETLETWRADKNDSRIHDFWRIAQLTGEQELNNLSILLMVTSKKPENVRWLYLKDVLALFDMCLCNREIITCALAFINQIQPVLMMTITQDCDERVYVKSLSIINKMLIVCGLRFAKFVLPHAFLDGLVEKIQLELPQSLTLAYSVLCVVQSMFMCGQEITHDYAITVMQRLSQILHSEVLLALAIEDESKRYKALQLHDLYEHLLKSIADGHSLKDTAAFVTKGKSKKDLLSECLDQQWLYLYCSWPHCGVHNKVPQTFFRKCGACSVVRFCSRQCQTKHWEHGHCSLCKVIAKRNRSVQ